MESIPWLLRRMCILKLLVEIFWKWLWNPFDLWCILPLKSLSWFFVKKRLGWSICPFMSRGVCFIKFGPPIIHAYMFIIIISSWYIFSLLICNDFLYIFWLILTSKLLCQIWIQLLLLAFTFNFLGKLLSILPLLVYVYLFLWDEFLADSKQLGPGVFVCFLLVFVCMFVCFNNSVSLWFAIGLQKLLTFELLLKVMY